MTLHRFTMGNQRATLRRRVAGILILLGFVSGCGGPDANRVLADGATLADELSTYYDSLSNSVLEHWAARVALDTLKLERETAEASARFAKAGAKSDTSAEDVAAKNIRKTLEQSNREIAVTKEALIHALRHRAEAARVLGSIYQALEHLNDPGSLKQAESAGENFGKAMASLPPLKGSSADISSGAAKAANVLLSWRKGRQLRIAMGGLAANFSVWKMNFEKDKETCLSIDEDRVSASHSVLEELAIEKMASPNSLLSTLRLPVAVKVPDSYSNPEAGLEIARIAGFRSNVSWSCATDQLQLALSGMESAQNDVQRGKTPVLQSVEMELDHAKSCLAEHESLVKGAE
ncbi:MAG: hypothetical protein P4K98_04240 [Bryobacteraceae bacterium]|nr:hypothetical protein [Bryobacteraceae bacterium]